MRAAHSGVHWKDTLKYNLTCRHRFLRKKRSNKNQWPSRAEGQAPPGPSIQEASSKG